MNEYELDDDEPLVLDPEDSLTDWVQSKSSSQTTET